MNKEWDILLTNAQQTEFIELRRSAIALDFAHLNPMQQQAVLATEGPLLLLAGAGSGKTTVLIHRIANLLTYGRGSDSQEVPEEVTQEDLSFLKDYIAAPQEADRARMHALCALDPVAPWSILAITFTNKAAKELKGRLERMLGAVGSDVWASTFHSSCVRILRRDIDKLGLDPRFAIYDSDDSVRLMKSIIKEQSLDDKMFPPRVVLSYISKAKDKLLSPKDYQEQMKQTGDTRLIRIAALYGTYQARLHDANALDFDDIIYHTVQLLLRDEETRKFYQRKFRYVSIDEYQDTNHLQYLLASTLAGGYENLCVVGDDDQSIYKFRGATIENIMSFEQQYKHARVIRLEQNYRSTKMILNASNAVIQNNYGRKGKQLWTEAQDGEQVLLYTAMNEHDEAKYIATQILEGVSQGRKFADHAVLYRMNAQSNQIETAFKRAGVPYKVFGGMRFFDRAEVKDMLAYLAVVNNPHDDLRLLRIINTPTRGIGARSLELVADLAQSLSCSYFDIIAQADTFPALSKSAAKLRGFADLIAHWQASAAQETLADFYNQLLDESGYTNMLLAKDDFEHQAKLENVKELATSITTYVDGAAERAEGEVSLAGFLQDLALYTDLDNAIIGDEYVSMMTMHTAKGLEFPVVFLAGCEDSIFPSERSIGEQEDLEEERRLCYVAMTRAKERLIMTCASQRMIFGQTKSNRPSRFAREIPAEYLKKDGKTFLFEGSMDFTYGGTNTTPLGYRAPSTAPSGARPSGGTGYTRAPAPAKASLPDFATGDSVVHTAFGEGVIIELKPMGGDALVEINFANTGVKRLMLKSAAAHMKKV